MINMVNNILNNQYPWEEINQIDVILIFKVKNPTHSKDFRPISICNALYNIIAKQFSIRISSILPSLIFDNQAIFFQVRFITYSAMIGLDVMHQIYTKKSYYNMALRLDMAKAFDRVD